jgi:Leucine-rich repeat (LRR) protein
MDKTIRENLNGKYLFVYTHELKETIQFVIENKLEQIRYGSDEKINNTIIDFKEIEMLAPYLKVISFCDLHGMEIINFESIYSLNKLEKIYINPMQNFTFDVSQFNKLKHLGIEYWKGIKNMGKIKTLESIVIIKYPYKNIVEFSSLNNLKTLHIYSSKIKTLEGIEKLKSLEELSLSRNNQLENINIIKDIKSLNKFSIEKCNKLIDYNFVYELENIKSLYVDNFIK